MLLKKSSFLVAALLSGTVMCAAPLAATAQNHDDNRQYGQRDNDQRNYPQPGYGPQVDRGQARANRIAYNNGMRAGSYDAQRDLNNHRGMTDFTRSQRYGDAAGWNAQMGDRNQYKQAFRQGYADGYHRTFERRGR